MDHSQLVGKIASDKDSLKLGQIIRIDKLLGKTIKTYEPFAMILIRKFLRKDMVVPLEAKKVTKVEGIYAWFNVTKAEFDEEVKRIKKIKAERETYTGTIVEQTNRNRYYSIRDFTGLSHKSKERKK
ncbi:MAG: hypothetical protein KGD59_11440 [Candidatus Heimdallarchaeota archaeon]|nr:hypothetical protein [Candidatus Heimdallarchaeota archaeon]